MNYQIQGLSIHAEVHGTAEPALVFLHYWGGTSALQPIPMILSGVIYVHRRCLHFGCAVLQILIEERLQYVPPELLRRVAVPFEWSQCISLPVHLGMPPWTHHQIVVIDLSFLLERQIAMNRPPHVLLIPQP